MIGHFIESRQLKAFHEHMLIVKVRHGAHIIARRLSTEPRAISRLRSEAPGIVALHDTERKRQIERIAHLRRATAEKGKAGVLAHIHDAARESKRGVRHHGCLLIHLTNDAAVADLRRALRRDPHIDFVARVPTRYALAGQPGKVPSIPFPLERDWNLQRIEWPAARRLARFRNAQHVRVVVLDSGVDVRHPALANAIGEYVHSHRDLRPLTSAKDLMGHGTHVCGILGARKHATLGPRGICHCSIAVQKVFVDHAPYDAALGLFIYLVDPVLYRRALADCADDQADVVNLSLGGTAAPDPCEASSLQTLLSRGATIVAAMGNARAIGSPVMYPAATPGVVAVGATDGNDVVAAFSSRGSHIALCAPGVSIWSTLPRYAGQFGYRAATDNKGHVRAAAPLSRNIWYDAWLGTSMATPHVTAAAVLLRASRRGIAGDEVRDRLMRTADRVAGMGRSKFTPDYGSGRLNLRRLLA